ncbi:MAG: hypothetical protein V3U87_03100 [Methylococcaceae bacterium]
MGICIYCRKDSSNSIEKPHIIPEGFMKNDITLPIGVECDGCNNYASKLEQSFIHHNRIWVPIMFLQAPGKSGKIRKNLGFYKAGEEKGKVTFSFPEKWVTKDTNGIHVQSPNPKEFNELKFRRCLGHITLNYIAWKLGWNVALESRFDNLRQFVRYGSREKMWPYGQVSFEDMKFRTKLSIGLMEEACGLIVRIESYIDDFFIDPLNEGHLEKFVNKQDGKECHYFQ